MLRLFSIKSLHKTSFNKPSGFLLPADKIFDEIFEFIVTHFAGGFDLVTMNRHRYGRKKIRTSSKNLQEIFSKNSGNLKDFFRIRLLS